ncbi:MAG: hypothetical protein R2778_18315 [Saprospiraceae bacterium]
MLKKVDFGKYPQKSVIHNFYSSVFISGVTPDAAFPEEMTIQGFLSLPVIGYAAIDQFLFRVFFLPEKWACLM